MGGKRGTYILYMQKIPISVHLLRNKEHTPLSSLVTEISKLCGKQNPSSLAAHRCLKEEHTRTILPAQAVAREALDLERTISDLVKRGVWPDAGGDPTDVGDGPAPDADRGSMT
jgi:hypothetical protein